MAVFPAKGGYLKDKERGEVARGAETEKQRAEQQPATLVIYYCVLIVFAELHVGHHTLPV